jgi:hypothetical protein
LLALDHRVKLTIISLSWTPGRRKGTAGAANSLRV